jgi:1-acyl-sn-glycerol-3-phosphate acyltransferase
MVLPRPPRLKLLPPEEAPPELVLGSPWRAAFRAIPYLLWTLLLLPVQAVAVALGLGLAQRLPVLYHRVCCRMLGMHVATRGRKSRDRPTLFVANHSSYLDIMVLGSLIPGSFVAKAEIAGWPFFGTLAKLQRSVFVDRKPQNTHLQRDEMQKRLDAGENLILFPEGTSDDGNTVEPFRSALLSVAERRVGKTRRPLTLQPVSIAYTRLNGVPLGYALRPLVAWYGDMDLAPHLGRFLGLGDVEVVVEFHEPVTIEVFGSRKALTDHCYRVVAAGVAAALAGRPQMLPAAKPARQGRGLGSAIGEAPGASGAATAPDRLPSVTRS